MEKLAYTVKEAAALLGVCERTVREMIYRGRIPFKRAGAGAAGRGGRILVPRAALEAWLAEADEPPASKAVRLALERDAAKRARKAARAAAKAAGKGA